MSLELLIAVEIRLLKESKLLLDHICPSKREKNPESGSLISFEYFNPIIKFFDESNFKTSSPIDECILKDLLFRIKMFQI